MDAKIWKNILSSYESKKNIWICRQLKYYQLRIRSETDISLEIILNAFNWWTVSLSTEILILAMSSILLISVSILCELVMLPDVYISLSPQKEEVHSSSWDDRCLSLFHLKNTASVTKSSHEDRGPCYLHLQNFFLYIHSPPLLEKKNLFWLLFSSVN